jgi:hypothetical protein
MLGKPEEEYTKHKIRDAAEEVTCPEFKTIKCNQCGEIGLHSSYFCPEGKLFFRFPDNFNFLANKGYKNDLQKTAKNLQVRVCFYVSYVLIF